MQTWVGGDPAIPTTIPMATPNLSANDPDMSEAPAAADPSADPTSMTADESLRKLLGRSGRAVHPIIGSNVGRNVAEPPSRLGTLEPSTDD